MYFLLAEGCVHPKSTAGQMTAEELALYTFSPSCSSIPEAAFPFPSAGQGTQSTASLFASPTGPSSDWFSPALAPPSVPPFLPPHSSISSVTDTGTPLPRAACHVSPLSSCSFPWKTNYHPQTHIFSKQPSHFVFASPSPLLSWVSLLFVLAILGWRLFGDENIVYVLPAQDVKCWIPSSWVKPDW